MSSAISWASLKVQDTRSVGSNTGEAPVLSIEIIFTAREARKMCLTVLTVHITIVITLSMQVWCATHDCLLTSENPQTLMSLMSCYL